MVALAFDNIHIKGIASVVPSSVFGFDQLASSFGELDASKLCKSTGVETRYIVDDKTTSADLCQVAAERLFSQLSYDKNKIDALIFVTQTPDYTLPASACVLQRRLGLSKDCAAFDVNLGCSGYTYGLWLASSILQGRGMTSVLLLAGDTISKITSPQDRSVLPLFGDAGTATIIEFSEKASSNMIFSLGTDGTGETNLIVPCGRFKCPRTAETSIRQAGEDGNIRGQEDLFMNGSEIFTFTLKNVPLLLDSVLAVNKETKDAIDFFVFHQANGFILRHLAKKMNIPSEKFLISIDKYGNTSSASIPLTLCHSLGGKSELALPARFFLAGFGVGYSWAGAIVSLSSKSTVTEVFIRK